MACLSQLFAPCELRSEGVANFDKEREPAQLLRFESVHHHQVGRRREGAEVTAIGQNGIDLWGREKGEVEKFLARGEIEVQGVSVLLFKIVERGSASIDGRRIVFVYSPTLQIFCYKVIPREKGFPSHDGLRGEQLQAAKSQTKKQAFHSEWRLSRETEEKISCIRRQRGNHRDRAG